LKEIRPDGSPWRTAYRALPEDPRTLDPQVSYDTLGNAVISLIYDCPLQYHPFKTDPYELQPCLLAEMPKRTRNRDGTETYLCRLKPSLTFHDDPCFTATKGVGREVTAEDLAYAFKRIADPNVECPVLSTLQDYVIGLGEAYVDAKKTGRYDYQAPLKGVEVVDRQTFRLHLKKPYPQILYWLAMPFTAPVPREAVEYYDGKPHGGAVRPLFRFHPVGTGAFRMVDWSRNRLIRLARFERYQATVFPSEGWGRESEARFRPLAGQALPFLDEVQFAVIREGSPRWLLFQQGYLDGAGVSKDVFSSVLSVSQELTDKYRARGVRLYRDSEPSTFYLVFNMDDPILGSNRKLRQAISCAYDEDLYNEIFSNGININAQQLLPPGVFGHQRDFRNPYKQHDLALARKLMAEAGYPEGRNPKTGQPLELTFDVTADSPESRQSAEFQRGQIEQLGIRIRTNENNWAQQQEKVDAGHFQMVMYGWHADYPDPENFFFLFYGANKPPRGSNHSRYSNPEFDRLFDRMCTMDSTPERLDLVHRLNALLVEDVPCVFLNHPVYFTLNQPWCPRVSSNSLLAGGLKYVDVDVKLRGEKQREWNRAPGWPLALLVLLVAGAIAYGIHYTRRHYV
jgi:ABC-type transport system substrate-binding protein